MVVLLFFVPPHAKNRLAIKRCSVPARPVTFTDSTSHFCYSLHLYQANTTTKMLDDKTELYFFLTTVKERI